MSRLEKHSALRDPDPQGETLDRQLQRDSSDQGSELARADDRPPLLSLLSLRNDTAKPMYQQLEEQLRALIEGGALPAGTTLPAERQLSKSLGISRATVQRTYRALHDRKLLGSHGRLGSIVQRPGARLHTGMDRLKGFSQEMHELGREPSSIIREQAVRTDRSIASIYGLPATAPFLKLVRIRSGDGVPLSHERAWYNLTAAPGLAELDLSKSVYAALEERCGLRLTHCEQSIEAAIPTREECEIFGLSEPLPCLLVKRRSYAGSVMAEYVEGLFRGDIYVYRLRLRA